MSKFRTNTWENIDLSRIHLAGMTLSQIAHSAWTNSRVTLSLTARFILSSQRMNKFKRLIFISLGEMTNYFFLQDMALECKLHMVSHYHKDYFKAHDISSSQHIDGLSKLKFFSRQNIEMLHDQHSLVGNHLLSLIFLWKFGIIFWFEIMTYPFPVFIFCCLDLFERPDFNGFNKVEFFNLSLDFVDCNFFVVPHHNNSNFVEVIDFECSPNHTYKCIR